MKQGDYGGPLICGSKKTLAGIASWSSGCGHKGYPSVYTATSQYFDWAKPYFYNDHDQNSILCKLSTS